MFLDKRTKELKTIFLLHPFNPSDPWSSIYVWDSFRVSVHFDYRLPPSRLGKAQACLVLLSLLCRFRLFWCESNNNIACSLWESTALSDRNYGTFYQKLPYFPLVKPFVAGHFRSLTGYVALFFKCLRIWGFWEFCIICMTIIRTRIIRIMRIFSLIPQFLRKPISKTYAFRS